MIPSTTLATYTKLSSAARSALFAILSLILYLSAPGEDMFGVAPVLSYSAVVSSTVTMS